MSWRWRDGLYLAVGGAIGWQLNVCSRVEGVSMMPTLSPQDRLLHVPYSLWCRAQQIRHWGTGDVSPRSPQRAGCNDPCRQNVVCKRVHRIVTSTTEVDDVHQQLFQSNDTLPYYAVAHEYDEEPDVNSISQAELDDRIAKEHYTDQRPFRRTDWDACRKDDGISGPSKGWVWVEGDNAADSFDSRSVGFVPVDCIRDVVLGRLWPDPRSL
ncbi:mitochondrial inner membrane signal peptidase, putative [Bodo saltans]|uniref:Mitochondrial inner membrane signal peptidase, putative n=1 Tax=Bodo saltans TaxID=75058 RepID=A0A0S4KL01_BODSA|nr:mitochondrial inner membrane signal peptidase, putative [Bodo saltans]|eukprot:CUI15260.1 mitochondrial inner membrane signal peptidase, putative [Bodo saltans]